jgi:hypothetical protein
MLTARRRPVFTMAAVSTALALSAGILGGRARLPWSAGQTPGGAGAAATSATSSEERVRETEAKMTDDESFSLLISVRPLR